MYLTRHWRQLLDTHFGRRHEIAHALSSESFGSLASTHLKLLNVRHELIVVVANASWLDGAPEFGLSISLRNDVLPLRHRAVHYRWTLSGLGTELLVYELGWVIHVLKLLAHLQALTLTCEHAKFLFARWRVGGSASSGHGASKCI